MRLRVGIDTGGTFTDLVALDEATGRLLIGKRPSTPREPARGVFDAFDACEASPADTASLVLGTTIATNAMLERRGATVLLVTTEGFEDVSQIGRVDKKDPYDLDWRKPRPLVRRRDCVGVRERVAADGAVLTALEGDELERAASWILDRADAYAAEGQEVAVAVALLFAYANPDHERALVERLRALRPLLPVSASHEVAPVWREYERASTAIADAFLKPVVARLVADCERGLAARGFAGSFSIVKSNGGQMAAAAAAAQPVQTVLSGLSGGIVAGRAFAARAGSRNVVTLDMGGTSADVGLVLDDEIGHVAQLELEWGIPLATPSIDLATIGAGGGSVAWIDEGGLLRVGPRSAGAVPGPACYGLGGEEPTVTDANLVLGRLDPSFELGGTIRLDYERARAAVAALGERLGLEADETALAIVEIANESMAAAVRSFAVERGVDPRDLDLVAFGGAGPLHAAEVAASLDIGGVVVPPHPGLASAFGALAADRRVDLRWTRYYRSDALDAGEIEQRLARMERDAVAALAAEGFEGTPAVLRSIGMRYAGQNHERDVPLPHGRVDAAALARAIGSFHELHEAAYGYAFPDEAIELIHFAVSAVGPSDAPALAYEGAAAPPEPVAVRDVRFAGGLVPTPVYRRDDLPAEWRACGPAVIAETDSTTLVLPGQAVEVGPGGLLRLGRRPEDAPVRREVDSVTMSIVGDRLVGIAQEMGTHMMRTAYSPIFSESRDFSCALFDAEGRLVAQGLFCPAHLGAIVHTVRCVLDELGPDALQPGDVVVHNDPYRGGCHMPEHMLLKPVFHGGTLVGYAAVIGHLAEIGAAAVGSFASTATEVYQEGLRLPPVRLLRRGEPVADVWKIVLSNHRTPRATWGDLHAMVGSLHVAERRLSELLDRHGAALVLGAAEGLIAWGERLMRARLAAIPEGEYRFEDEMEDDGIGTEPVRIRAAVVVAGGRLLVDYTGSDGQARGPVNATYGVTTSATFNAMLQLAGGGVPRNAGAYRCAKTIAPLGSVVNVRFPGPSVGGNTETQPKLVGMIFGALAPALPDRVMAAEGVTSCNFLFGGVHPETGQPYAHYHFEASGWGGRAAHDGSSAQNHIHGNCRNTPIEVFETRFPLRVRRYELVPDSGGPGRRRGGLATRRVLEVAAPDVTVSALMDRVQTGAWGLFGGLPGRTAAILVRRRGEPAFRTFPEAFGTASPSKFAGIVLREGDEILIESAGGGGFGDPRERERERVLEDVAEGYVTPEAAVRDYGVVPDA